MKKPKTQTRQRPVMMFLRRQQVTAFFTLLRNGAYDGREKERQAVLQMFNEASKAGVIK